jgi:hypothetical protein
MATTLVYQDVLQLLKDAQKTIKLRLLPHVQYDERHWARPSQMMGVLLVYPDDDYWLKTKQETWGERRLHPGPGIPVMGLGIEFDLHRAIKYKHHGFPSELPPMVYLSLQIHHGRELDAFREIYDNYRGIVGKLLDRTSIEFFMSAVVPEVDQVHSKKPLPKLDAVLHLAEPNPDDQCFELQYTWYRRSHYDEGLKVFRTLAILFTCIQKASAAPRSQKDHLLSYWNSII